MTPYYLIPAHQQRPPIVSVAVVVTASMLLPFLFLVTSLQHRVTVLEKRVSTLDASYSGMTNLWDKQADIDLAVLTRFSINEARLDALEASRETLAGYITNIDVSAVNNP